MAFKAFLSVLILGFATQATAFWVLGCGKPVSIDRVDPIVSPGALSGHLHTIMGGDAFDWDMDFNKTQSSKCTTCAVSKDLSNYWVPTVYYHDKKNNSFFSVEQVGGVNVYYQQRIDHTELEANKTIQPFPNDFRMVAGDAKTRNWTDTLEHRAIEFICLLENGEHGLDPFHGFPNRTCDGGLQIRVRFPCCWDGKNSDSHNHRDHVAYPSMVDNGVCPETHPVRLMSLLYESTWSVKQFDHLWKTGDQPFVLSNGDPTGYSYHGDFLNGWDHELLTKAISDPSCLDKDGGRLEACEPFQPFLLSGDDQIWECKTITRKTKEPVYGDIDTLPGCNPIQDGPGEATDGKC